LETADFAPIIAYCHCCAGSVPEAPPMVYCSN